MEEILLGQKIINAIYLSAKTGECMNF
jgi:hypothetical protein